MLRALWVCGFVGLWVCFVFVLFYILCAMPCLVSSVFLVFSCVLPCVHLCCVATCVLVNMLFGVWCMVSCVCFCLYFCGMCVVCVGLCTACCVLDAISTLDLGPPTSSVSIEIVPLTSTFRLPFAAVKIFRLRLIVIQRKTNEVQTRYKRPC